MERTFGWEYEKCASVFIVVHFMLCMYVGRTLSHIPILCMYLCKFGIKLFEFEFEFEFELNQFQCILI